MKKIKIVYFLCVLIPVFLFTDCRKNKNRIGDLDEPNLGSVIDPPSLIFDSLSESSGLVCSEKKYAWAPGNPEPLLLNPATDAIYPGAMLGGGSIRNGDYAVITGKRAPLTLSVSLANVSQASTTVPEATLSNVREGIIELLGQNLNGSIGAEAAYDVFEVYSENHLKVMLGAHGSFGFGDIKASFDFSSSSTTRKFVAKFTQIYYSVDIDFPPTPEEFWKRFPNIETFHGYVPAVVSSVKYGRVILFMMEVDESSRITNAAIEAQFNSGGFEAALADSVRNALVSKKLLVVGGNTAAINIGNEEELNAIIASGAEFNLSNPGKPIAYTMKFIHNNSVANVVSTSEYTVKDCQINLENHDVVDPTIISGPFCPTRQDGNTRIGNQTVLYDISANLTLSPDSSELLLNFVYSVNEDGGDHTSGYGVWQESIYTAPPTKKIKRILSDLGSGVVGQVTEHQTGTQERQTVGHNNELVSKFKFTANVPGKHSNEMLPYSGGCSSANIRLQEIHLNSIRLELEDL